MRVVDTLFFEYLIGFLSMFTYYTLFIYVFLRVFKGLGEVKVIVFKNLFKAIIFYFFFQVIIMFD